MGRRQERKVRHGGNGCQAELAVTGEGTGALGGGTASVTAERTQRDSPARTHRGTALPGPQQIPASPFGGKVFTVPKISLCLLPSQPGSLHLHMQIICIYVNSGSNNIITVPAEQILSHGKSVDCALQTQSGVALSRHCRTQHFYLEQGTMQDPVLGTPSPLSATSFRAGWVPAPAPALPPTCQRFWPIPRSQTRV